MGYGDEIMATAFAKIEKQKYPEREVVVGDFKSRKANYSKVFYNNPNISDPRKLDKNKIIHFVNLVQINLMDSVSVIFLIMMDIVGFLVVNKIDQSIRILRRKMELFK